jgi:hypothetical protein
MNHEILTNLVIFRLHLHFLCATTQAGDFEAEDTRRDRMACVKATQGAVAGHMSDGATTKIPKVPLRGVYPSIRP